MSAKNIGRPLSEELDDDERGGNTFRDGKIHVAAEACDACLLTPKRIVSGAAAAEIVRSTKDEPGATFTCHKFQIASPPVGDAICFNWFEKFADKDPILQVAQRMGVIERQELPPAK